ncbi:hypothetical protein J7E49_04825 [Variovorax paradoxus]|nr:hypothetical protein [Variovorax paradoxus]
MALHLFSPFSVGRLSLPNRLVMAPMTRNRADRSGIPTPPMATYYGQRADASLIISESSPISAQGSFYGGTVRGYTDYPTYDVSH